MNGEEMKLLGCPFCGCAPAVSSYETGNEDDVAWVVACDCKLAPEDQPYAERYLSAHGQTREEVVRHWNARAPVNRPAPEAGESGLVERLNGMAGTGGRITCMAEYNGGAVASSQSIAAALCADAADEITNLQAELAEARKERDELRWAIMGGEDAPGVLDTVTHDEVLKALQESRSNWKSYAEMVAAERDRLSAALGEAERAINRAKEAVEDQDDIELVGSLAAALSTLKTAREGNNA